MVHSTEQLAVIVLQAAAQPAGLEYRPAAADGLPYTRTGKGQLGFSGGSKTPGRVKVQQYKILHSAT